LSPSNFELHPIGAGIVICARISRPSRATRTASSAVNSRRVGQNRVPLSVNKIEQILAIGVDQPLAADRHRDALRA